MGRLTYVAALLMTGLALVMLDPPHLAPPLDTGVVAASSAPAPTAFATALPAITPSAAPTPSTAPAGRDISGARIVIERLAIDLPLEWGDIGRDVPRDDYPGSTPERVALVFPGSALPGGDGNTYIYSHARVGMFLALWNVRIGDVVELRWPDASMRYEVREIHPRVSPADTTWLDAAGPERLTLQTSTGPVPQDPRFIAIAKRVSS